MRDVKEHADKQDGEYSHDEETNDLEKTRKNIGTQPFYDVLVFSMLFFQFLSQLRVECTLDT
ncbi:Uncharacterised protein [Mycobacteroides abscessus subsp. abscessus]|nr:Uncharacterised protein [Mycobacteroides abscessus subsp. abscessus]